MANIAGYDGGNARIKLARLPEGSRTPQNLLPPGRGRYDHETGLPSTAFVAPPDGSTITVFDPKKGTGESLSLRTPRCAVRAVKTLLDLEALELPQINRPVSPLEVYAAGARDALNLVNSQRLTEDQQPVYQLVMTYPGAYADPQNPDLDRVNAMRRSLEAVELDCGRHPQVLDSLPEPVAGILAYCHSRRDGGPMTCLSADIGDGTADFAVVTFRGKDQPYQVHQVGGLPDIGGQDFTRRLLELVTGALKSQYAYEVRDPVELELLRRNVLDAKHRLSDTDAVELAHQTENGPLLVTVTREAFEEATRDMLQTIQEKALQVASASGKHIDRVVCFGGGSLMPMIPAALGTLLPDAPVEVFDPFNAIADGAAIYASGLQTNSDRQVYSEVATVHTMFPYSIRLDTVPPAYLQILSRDTPLPATSQPHKFPFRAGRNAVPIYRRAPEGYYINLIWLYLDLPRTGSYDLTLTVLPDYNLTLTATGPEGTKYTASTHTKEA